jgi:GNAT superfamily N-acetyltransferase
VRPLPPDLVDRDLEAADVPAAAVLVNRCDATYREWAGPDWDPPSFAAEAGRWERALGRADRWARGAFDADGELVGAVGWRPAEDEAIGPIPGVAHVYAVFTDPRRWGEGIGSNLLAQAEASMVPRGFRIARLWTPRDAPARYFYESEGWTRDGRSRWDEQFGLDLVGYEKRVSPSR